MNTFEKLDLLLKEDVYGLSAQDKKKIFIETIREVSLHHYKNCKPYQRLCGNRNFDPEKLFKIEDLPYLPASIFKETLLLSVNEDKIFREIKSSATSSGRPSRVGLDRVTSRRQIKCFNKVVTNRIGSERYKFVVLDEPSSIDRSSIVSARSSTIRSLLFCSKEVETSIINEGGQLRLDEKKLDYLLKEAEDTGEKIIIFGFTFILYKYVVQQLIKSGKRYNLNGSKIIHIGGWKKLEKEKVTPGKLIDDCCRVFGVSKHDVIDFYGFTEQSGLIYPTCEEGLRHTPVWAEVIVRDSLSLKSLPFEHEGLLQFITPIQTSYPGHSVLTEDVGYITGIDKCLCGRMGKTFEMTGRASGAEVRGCGDIMGDSFS